MKTLTLAILLAAGGAVGCAWADALAPLQTRIDRAFDPWTQASAPGCAVGVVDKGNWLVRKGYGAARLEQSERITPQTVFYVASVSKQFTAAALLVAVDQGRLQLDDDIRQHVPELPTTSPPIRLKHLVHHSSGLADYLDLLQEAGTLHRAQPAKSAIALLAAQRPGFAAGLMSSYSNSNYLLLGEAIARATGSSLREFARRNLFVPLGMVDTHFHDDPNETVPRRADGHVEKTRGDFQVVRTGYSFVGAGGLLTTLDDLGRWSRIFDDPGAIPGSPNLGRRLQVRGTLSDGGLSEYAFGLIGAKVAGLDAATHAGHFPGYSAAYTWIPSRRTAAFVLCNWSAPIQAIHDTVVLEALR